MRIFISSQETGPNHQCCLEWRGISPNIPAENVQKKQSMVNLLVVWQLYQNLMKDVGTTSSTVTFIVLFYTYQLSARNHGLKPVREVYGTRCFHNSNVLGVIDTFQVQYTSVV